MGVAEDVGMCAGDVYTFLLNDGGEVPVMKLIKGVNREDDLVIAALGWLLREDKIEVRKADGGMTVKLKG